MSFGEKGRVLWSGNLEKIADQLLISVRRSLRRPFDKVCIVINDPATENWLKQYWLLERKVPLVLMNLDFVKLPEFLNDWLAAELHGIPPQQRKAAQHPYSPEVMTWRLYRILFCADPDGELRELLSYVGSDASPRRRFALAGKLAELYDGYQNSRIRMLRNWEEGKNSFRAEIPPWQIPLYRLLAQEIPQTYAKDYESAFQMNPAASRALESGFPHYRAVHVLDIPFMPEPMLHLLEKISETLPLNFWCFNPQNDWLADTPSKHEAVRCIQKHREALHSGEAPENPELIDFGAFYTTPEERLCGALASGARALIRNLCDDSGGNVEVVGEEDAIDRLKQCRISIHRCYSPRRELEAVKNGLHAFFDRNPEVSPHQVLILCADWANYAPILETVFGGESGAPSYLPVSAAGNIAGETPFSRSLDELLAFRENRFEAGAVFNLLQYPAIRGKFGIDENGTAVLRNMVKTANIHWGFDDDDVKKILARSAVSSAAERPFAAPFTWQRGMDRLISEMFFGFPDEDDLLLKCGKLGELHPCGHVEGSRAELLAALWNFVRALKQLRQRFDLERQGSPEEIKDDLMWLLDTFFMADETNQYALTKARECVRKVANAVRIAKIPAVHADVFLIAVQNALSSFVPALHAQGDSILFAPLNCFTATPHKLIWICGLNDGKFPRIEYRPSYDLIGLHPSLFDTTPRERGSFALLKAALCAKEELALSFVGRDIRTNEEIPPSVLLNDLKDYFSSAALPVAEFDHPMHAYSSRYFQKPEAGEAPLPPSYSAADEKIARQLGAPEVPHGIVPFPLNETGITEIELNDLSRFLAFPNRYLLESRRVKIPQGRFDRLSGKESFDVRFNKKRQRNIALTGECDPRAAAVAVETGEAPDENSAAAALEEMKKTFQRSLYFGNPLYNVSDGESGYLKLAEAYRLFSEKSGAAQSLDFQRENQIIRLRFEYSFVQFETEENLQKFSFHYDHYADKTAFRNSVWLFHLAANASEGEIASVLFGPRKNCLLFRKMSIAEAQKRLLALLELLSSPLPAEYPGLGVVAPDQDQLPPSWQAKLWSEEDCVNGVTKRGRKKQER